MKSEHQLVQDASYATEVLLLRQLRDRRAVSERDYTDIRKLISGQLNAKIYLE